jgi:tetratricopeptide (TPR) repeat protein
MNKWTRRFEWNHAAAEHAASAAGPTPHHYFAFLSYSHEDSADADWLHGELERFRVPSSLTGRLTGNGVVPKRLTPIFRDRHDLAAGHDLNAEIRAALAASRCLIVLCSPAAAKSKWTNAEVDAFKRLHPEGCIIAAVIAGEPLASDIPGREDEECFPPALVAKYNRRGKPTGHRTEPLAADLREGKGGRRTGFLKIVAGILGVALDDLVQRDNLRRQRRLALVSGGSLAGMVIASVLAVTAIQARDAARDQRREAESLVQFMLGDLKDKLEPIGKLDALDGVAARVLQYYQRQDTSQLSDQGLAQRSSALSLMADVAQLRGNWGRALRLYGEALAGTQEAMRRDPDNPERIFEHAQNVFYIGEIQKRLGRPRAAEAAMREYKRLADRMVALDPDNIRWRMEEQYALANLGIVLFVQRRFPEAVTQLRQSLAVIDGLALTDPNNREYQQSLAEGLAWLADAQASAGRLADATATRERHVALLTRLLAQSGDVAYRQRLVGGERGLGNIYAERGQLDVALRHYRAAAEQADRLYMVEPANRTWIEIGSGARLDLATYLLAAGQRAEAESQAKRACDGFEGLLRQDKDVPDWQAGVRECWLLRAQLALSSGAPADGVSAAGKGVAIARVVKSSDPVSDRFALARSERILGDAANAAGQRAQALAAWSAAAAALPSGFAEQPRETAERVAILKRLGRGTEASRLAAGLKAAGYSDPETK